MKYFGSDIGCKNLAYCVFNYDENTKKIHIEQWDLIDLRDCKCDRMKRGGKVCNQTASYYYIDDNNNKHLTCKTHKNSKCKKIKNEDNDNLDIYAKNLKLYFNNENHNILDCDRFGIENQPSIKNPKMKSIQMILFSYISFFKNKNCNIDLIHPKMKTSMIGKEADNIIKNKKNKTERKQYLTTKHLGIIFTQYILEHEVDNYNEWIDTFKDKKKQDDLCDSFLHAYYLLFGANCKINDKEFIDYVHNEIDKMDNNIKSAKLSK